MKLKVLFLMTYHNLDTNHGLRSSEFTNMVIFDTALRLSRDSFLACHSLLNKLFTNMNTNIGSYEKSGLLKKIFDICESRSLVCVLVRSTIITCA